MHVKKTHLRRLFAFGKQAVCGAHHPHFAAVGAVVTCKTCVRLAKSGVPVCK